jgi:hypothetical protein
MNKIFSFSVGGVSISIPSDPPIAGESYTLECSAGGSEGTFQWLKGPPDGRTPVVTSGSITISSTSTTSQLQFRPVQQSDNGSYICSAAVDGLAIMSGPVITTVNGIILLDYKHVIGVKYMPLSHYSLSSPLCFSPSQY